MKNKVVSSLCISGIAMICIMTGVGISSGAQRKLSNVEILMEQQDVLAKKVEHCLEQQRVLLDNQEKILKELDVIRMRVSRN